MPRVQNGLHIGHVVFNIYSLRVGRVIDIRRISKRLGQYTPDLVRVEVTKTDYHGVHIRKVRWRIDNCRRFTPRALRARQAFLQLAQALEVSPRRLLPRRLLWQFGFNQARQRMFIRRLWRVCRIKLSPRQLNARQTSNQVIAATLASPVMPTHR